MNILGIETSCDETAVAVVKDGRKVLANVIASQVDLHAKTGGVVPEVAAREHVLKMIPVLEECLREAEWNWEDIDALAVTKGPGLVSSLIIGTETASVISQVKGIPLIPVQHIIGHIYSNWLGHDEEIQFPLLVLTVSGGHNEIYLMRDHYDFELLGETRDDASGEAFDKVARLLGLGYPGGPEIAREAEKGDPDAFQFPRVMLEKDSLDFSFSGLKTAVLTEVKQLHAKGVELNDAVRCDLAASFQEAAVDILSAKLMRALEMYPDVKEIHLAGGVSANRLLRARIGELKPDSVEFRFPQSIRFCTDNAAMIAGAGYYLWQKDPDKFKVANITPCTSFSL